MLTLGIDTAGRRASTALLDEDDVVGSLERSGPHSSSLLPAVSELFDHARVQLGALDLIAVSRGPGSYTGLRVGVVSAKVLAWTSAVPLLGISTLEARASQAPAEAPRVLVALHAYKKRMLYRWYSRDPEGALRPEAAPALVQATAVPRAGNGEAVVTDAPELLYELSGWGAAVVTPEDGAVAVARLARQRWLAGASDEAISLVPDYLRPPSVTLKPGVAPGQGKVPPRRGKGSP